ncbi:MAG: V-type ATP synthase subunit D [Candidatus Borkfalkiaceae bacterium]|nr:V-type ATP synthase subunit D [Christensenellaceae bacterium]
MARINVNPTRMELNKLKARLKTATRGHKLLKDKTDEMIRRFSIIIRENKRLREDVENEIKTALSQFSVARSLMSEPEVKLAFSMPSVSVDLSCGTENIMSVTVPRLTLSENRSGEKFPYAFTEITSEADKSVELMGKTLVKLVKLAEVEKTAAMLADEIEKSKRRVNALEYIMIPDIEETIKYISMKLEENDRSSRTRLMKVKTMISERS